MGLYDNVKLIAYQKGINVQDLEVQTGLPRNSLSKWNINVPSIEKVTQVAKALDCSIERIVGMDEPDPREMAFQRPELKTLFDLAKDAPTEDIEYVIKKLEKLR